MAMARKAAFFPALLAQPSLGWDSFLCLGVLVWPRSDLPLALIRKYLPDGPSPRGLWVQFMKMKYGWQLFSYCRINQNSADGVADPHTPGLQVSTPSRANC